MNFNDCKKLNDYRLQMRSHALAVRDWVERYGPDQVELFESVFESWANEIGSLPKSPHTIKNWITMLRVIFMEATADMDGGTRIRACFMRNFKLPEDSLEKVTKRAEERLQERAHNQIKVDSKRAERIIEGINRYRHLPVSGPLALNVPKHRHVWCIAVSGRRPIEIRAKNFCDHFSDGIHEIVKFSGQAKTRDNDQREYDIPILGTSAALFMAEIKTHLCGFPASELRPYYDRLRDEIGEDWPDIEMTARTLRAWYACATYAQRPESEEGRQKWHWINQVLGHEPEDTATCQTYNRFEIERLY